MSLSDKIETRVDCRFFGSIDAVRITIKNLAIEIIDIMNYEGIPRFVRFSGMISDLLKSFNLPTTFFLFFIIRLYRESDLVYCNDGMFHHVDELPIIPIYNECESEIERRR